MVWWDSCGLRCLSDLLGAACFAAAGRRISKWIQDVLLGQQSYSFAAFMLIFMEAAKLTITSSN